MNRWFRIGFEIVAPPLVASLCVFATDATGTIADLVHGHPNWEEYFGIILMAYVIAGVPTLVSAGLMEIAFTRYFQPRSWRTVVLGSVLGCLSGVAIGWFLNCIDRGGDGEPHAIVTMLPLGFVVGLIVSATVMLCSKENRTSPPQYNALDLR